MFYRRWSVWGLAAVVIGCVLGNAVDRIPISLVARSIVATVMAWQLGLLLVSFVLLFRSPYAGEIGAPSGGLREVLLTTVAAVAVGVLLHAVASWKGLGLSPELLSYRTEGIAIAGFVAGSIQAAVVCGLDR